MDNKSYQICFEIQIYCKSYSVWYINAGLQIFVLNAITEQEYQIVRIVF